MLPKLKEVAELPSIKPLNRPEIYKQKEEPIFPPVFNPIKPIGNPLGNYSREKPTYMNDRINSGYEKDSQVPKSNHFYVPKYGMNYAPLNPIVPKKLPPISSFSSVGNNILGNKQPLGRLRF